MKKNDQAVLHLCKAVRIPTISFHESGQMDPVPFLTFHDFLQDTYPLMHQAMTRETVDGLALLYRWPGLHPELPPVLLMAHMDVVPPGDPEAWTHPPFAGILTEDGYIWGRGTLDMKGQLIAICEACEGLLAEGTAPKRDVYLSFGYDEELMRESSAAKTLRLLESRGLRFSLVLDEGICVDLSPLGVTKDVVALCVAEKGYADIRLTARGKAGHASAPPKDTALGELGRGIVALADTPMPRGTDCVVETVIKQLTALLPAGTDVMALLERDPKLDALTRTTLAPTMAKGSDMSNVLPETASCVFNVRIAPWDTIEDVLAHMKRLAPTLEWDMPLYHPPVPAADLQGAAYFKVSACAKAAFPGTDVLPYVMTAATDSRYFTGICDNILRLTPFRHGKASLMHGVDERVLETDFMEAIAFFRLLLSHS